MASEHLGGPFQTQVRETVIFTNTLGATGRVYDVADASGRLLAPASCTNMCDIDSMRFERHDSVLAG